MCSRVSIACCAIALLLITTDAVAQDSLGGRLRFQRSQVQAGRIAGSDLVDVSIRFAEAPSPEQLQLARDAGARFHAAPAGTTTARARMNGSADARRRGVVAGPGGDILGGRTVFPARIAWPDLDRLASLPFIMRIESGWKPRRVPPLHQTRELCEVDQVWQIDGPGGIPLDGTGVLIADIDTGVDLFHPDFWRADGPVRNWIDVDFSGSYTAGDAVDVNGNDSADAGETLAWYNAPGTAPGSDATLQLDIDHFYQDVNGNGVRDFGPPAFTESDPTYGEALFRPLDTNENGVLDPGEQLATLSSCKVLAVYEIDETVRRAGVDLIFNEGDTYSHGTNVGSILVGGEKGRRFSGIAPGASLIFGNLGYGPEPPFVSPIDLRMSWAAAEGADILNYEDGEWIWEFLDGSSNVEILMNELAEQGIVNVVAAGNLATGRMHTQGDLSPSVGSQLIKYMDVGSPSVEITVAWGNFYFQPEIGDEVVVSIQTPAGGWRDLDGSGTDIVNGYEIYHSIDTSPRGTRRVDFRLALSGAPPASNLNGAWRFAVTRTAVAPGGGTLTVHGMCLDEVSSWYGYSTWRDATFNNTITWPATADSSLTVAAYSPDAGTMNSFSGRGTRIDGVSLIDIAAPGSTTYAGYRKESAEGVPGGYKSFGGTSAATPHVSGVIALLLQWDPSLTPGEIRQMIRAGAGEDAATGTTPNDTWGAGKLLGYQSLMTRATDAPAAPRPADHRVRMHPNLPNPFNPGTEIRYTLEHSGLVVVEVFDLRGRKVRALHSGEQDAGLQSVHWDGRDDDGSTASSGIYLVRVMQDGAEAARKVSLLK